MVRSGPEAQSSQPVAPITEIDIPMSQTSQKGSRLYQGCSYNRVVNRAGIRATISGAIVRVGALVRLSSHTSQKVVPATS